MTDRAFRILVWHLAVVTAWAWFSTNLAEAPPVRDGLDVHPPAAVEVVAPEPAADSGDVEMLAELAAAEDPAAAVAVTWTVLNRARASGLALQAVVAAPGQFGTKLRSGRWLPSWPRPDAWRLDHAELIHRLRPHVEGVLAGRTPDPTGGATHFHRLGTWTPPWAPEEAQWRIHGVHAFYKARPAEPTARPEALRAPDGLPLAPGGPEGS